MLVQICVVVCLWYRRIWEYIQLKTPIRQGSATRNITVYFVVRKLHSYHVIYTVFTLTSTTWLKYWHQQTVLSEVDCSQNSEAWATTSLYFLKQLKWAGAVLNDLLNFYCSVIRPVLEYASPVSHSSLTVALEYLQKRAMNSVFSGGIDYTTCLIIAGVLARIPHKTIFIVEGFCLRLHVSIICYRKKMILLLQINYTI